MPWTYLQRAFVAAKLRDIVTRGRKIQPLILRDNASNKWSGPYTRLRVSLDTIERIAKEVDSGDLD